MITEKSNLDIDEIIELPNIAEMLEDNHLNQIGAEVLEDLAIDERSQEDWVNLTEKALDLAKMKHSEKHSPWPKASNIKLPIITNSAIQFAARTIPEVIKDKKVVHVAANGESSPEKEDRARRVSDHMSYQLLLEDSNWRSDTDKLLHNLAIVGTVHRKTYFDPVRQKNVSELLTHDELVINNNIKSLEEAPRISHLIMMSKNEVVEKIRAGIFKDINIDELDPIIEDDFNRFEIVEQHRSLDLDGDGYDEPYIVIVERSGGKVLRIVARYDEDGILRNEDGDIQYIEPIIYFTDYHLIHSPDGSYFSLGFGTLLAHFNEAANTITNQLIDAGTLANMQGGFIGTGLRTPKESSMRFKPGEWKRAQTSMGSRIGDNIFPLVYKEPSAVLFQLLGMLLDTAKDITNLTDVLTGQQSAQNVPATTIMALVEQGMKVFTAIQSRLHVSFGKEFKKLYRLNRIFLPEEKYSNFGDSESYVLREDYEDDSLDITPVSDPRISSEAQRLARSQALISLTQMPVVSSQVNIHEIVKRYTDDIGIPNRAAIVPDEPPQAPPSPELLELQAKMDETGKKLLLKERELDQKDRDTDVKEAKALADLVKAKAEAIEKIAKAESYEPGQQLDLYREMIKQIQFEIKRRDDLNKQRGNPIDGRPQAS